MPARKPISRSIFAIIAVVLLIGAGVLIIPFVLVAGPADADATMFYKFKPGTTWIYERKNMETGEKKRIVETATKEEGGQVYFERKTFDIDKTEPENAQVFVRYIEKGYVMQNVVHGVAADAWPLYRLGSRKGQTWKCISEGEIKIRNLGIETVTVDAGTFRNAVNLRAEMPFSVIDFYFAPGTGLVKQVEELRADPDLDKPARIVSRMELVEFKPAP